MKIKITLTLCCIIQSYEGIVMRVHYCLICLMDTLHYTSISVQLATQRSCTNAATFLTVPIITDLLTILIQMNVKQ